MLDLLFLTVFLKLPHIYIHLLTISRFYNNLVEMADKKRFELIKSDDIRQGQKNIKPQYKVIH